MITPTIGQAPTVCKSLRSLLTGIITNLQKGEVVLYPCYGGGNWASERLILSQDHTPKSNSSKTGIQVQVCLVSNPLYKPKDLQMLNKITPNDQNQNQKPSDHMCSVIGQPILSPSLRQIQENNLEI